MTWGRYRLDVASDDRSIPPTSVTFDAGFYADASADTPDLLEIALDKPEYAAGDTMTVAVTARTAGKVTLNVVGDKLFSTTTTDVQAGTARIPLTVGRDWGTGAYVVATLRRPLDEAASRMPGRAIGLQWFSVDKKARTLRGRDAAADADASERSVARAAEARRSQHGRGSAGSSSPQSTSASSTSPTTSRRRRTTITSASGASPPRCATSTASCSTACRARAARSAPAAMVRGAALAGTPPTQPPLALYSGIVTVKSDGWAEVLFDIPAFSGSVRVMAVAWSKDKVGKASADVTVRDPVVLTATLPRFLLTGDRGTIRLDLDNVEGPTGDYAINVQTSGRCRSGRRRRPSSSPTSSAPA